MAVARPGNFRQPLVAVKMHKQRQMATALQARWNEQRPDDEFLPASWRGGLLDPRMLAGVLRHGGWILLALRRACATERQDGEESYEARSHDHQKCVAMTFGGPPIPSIKSVESTTWRFMFSQPFGANACNFCMLAGSLMNS